MRTHITHFKNNRSPSLFGTILIDGVPVNLTGGTVKNQLREVGATSLTVDAAATLVAPTLGQVRYDWLAADVDTAGFYEQWWHVTLSGLVQETPKSMFEIVDPLHVGNEYVSVVELKESMGLSDTTFADYDLAAAVATASRSVDGICDRRFYLGAPAEVRKYTPISRDYLIIDDCFDVDTVVVDGDAWTLGVEFMQEGTPVTTLLRTLDGNRFPRHVQNSVVVTGQFGWDEVPAEVKTATKILAARYLNRIRQSPHGVVSFGIDGGSSFLPLRDPDLETLLADYTKSAMVQ